MRRSAFLIGVVVLTAGAMFPCSSSGAGLQFGYSGKQHKEHRELVDTRVQRLTDAAPADAKTEFDAMVKECSSSAATEIAVTLIQKGILKREAATFLQMREKESIYAHLSVDLNADLIKLVIPALLDDLESGIPPTFENASDHVKFFDAIPIEFAERIRRLSTHENPNKRVEACRLLARLASPTPADHDAIIHCLSDLDNVVVKSALGSAVAKNDVSLLPSVRKTMSHVNDMVAIDAAAATLQILQQHPDYAGQDEIETEAVAVLSKLYFATDSEETRRTVMYASADTGRPMLKAPEMLFDALRAPSEIQNGGYFSFDTGMYLRATSTLSSCGSACLPVVQQWLEDEMTSDVARSRLLGLLHYTDADKSAMKPIIEQQLKHSDPAVQQETLDLLAAIGDVNAVLLQDLKMNDSVTPTNWVQALGHASPETRAVAIPILTRQVTLEGPAIHRIAAAKSLTALGEFPDAVNDMIISHLETLGELDWETWLVLQEVATSLRPTPPNLLMELRKASMKKKASVRCAELLASLDDSAFDARIELLLHPKGDFRAAVLSQLSRSTDERALAHIVNHLFDMREYFVSTSSHTGFDQPVRCAAIEALASPVLNVEPIVPMLCDLLQVEWAAESSATALGNCSASSLQSLPRLKAIKLNRLSDRSLAVAAAIAKLEKNDAARMESLKKLLDLITQPQHNWFAGTRRLGDTIVELHDQGINVTPLKEKLTFLAMEQPCLSLTLRMDVVYVLAVIAPEDSRWHNMLRHWKSEEQLSFSEATTRLNTLSQRK